jgi:DNA-binding MarR family transcriptional regulator
LESPRCFCIFVGVTNVELPNETDFEMPTAQPFSPRLIGQTEKAMNALLDRELSGTGVSEPEWVTLVLAVTSTATADRRRFAGEVSGALKVAEADAAARIGQLAARGLLEAPDEGSEVRVTEAGRALHDRVRAAAGEITRRLWGDLPDEELAAAARVLSTVLERAEADLATKPIPGSRLS